MPPHWYLVHLRTPSWGLAGASMIGSPALATGHNGFAAWGVTAGLADTTDLFLEQFALRHLDELPRSEELAIALRPEPWAL